MKFGVHGKKANNAPLTGVLNLWYQEAVETRMVSLLRKKDENRLRGLSLSLLFLLGCIWLPGRQHCFRTGPEDGTKYRPLLS